MTNQKRNFYREYTLERRIVRTNERKRSLIIENNRRLKVAAVY